MGASLRDRATRPSDQAPAGLGDPASVPSAALAFAELIERNTPTLDDALILANNVAKDRKWDTFVVEPWMPSLIDLKWRILGDAEPEDIQRTECWEWWAGDNDEVYRIGPCGTRAEALEEALDYFDGHTVYLIEATRRDWPAPSAVSVIDDMLNNADDLFSEDLPDLNGAREQHKRAEEDLQRSLDAWMNRWRDVIFPAPTVFGRTRNAEIVLAHDCEALCAASQGGNEVPSSGTQSPPPDNTDV